METQKPPFDSETQGEIPVNLKYTAYRGGIKPKKGLSKTAKWGIGAALTLGVSVLGLNTYLNRAYTESVCKTTPLTAMMWQGGDDAKRTETIQKIEQYLSTTDNRDDQILGEAALELLRANTNDVDVNSFDSDVAENSVIQYLSYINDMRGDRFDEALETITNAIDNRALDCAETGAWDTNNRRNNIIRYAFNNSHFDSAYKIASHIFSNDPTTQYQLNLWAGQIQLHPDTPDADASTARMHFENARGLAESDVNIARTEYYLGQAYNALNDTENSLLHYTNASHYAQNIYGQLGAQFTGKPVDVTIPAVTNKPNDPPLAMAVTIDDCTDRLLIDQRANIQAVPASLTKMMTLYTVAQTIAMPNTDFNFDTSISVPQIAHDKIESDLAVFEALTVGRSLPAGMFMTMTGAKSDALSAVTIAFRAAQARGWKGTPEQLNDRFVHQMNLNAQRLGMTNTDFGNVIGNNAANGDDGNLSTPHDIIKLMNAFHRDYPQSLEISLGQREIDIRPVSTSTFPSSRNLRYNLNVQFAKTGFTDDAGYNEALKVEFRDITGRQSTATIAVFGADSADNRYDVIRGVISHLPQIDTRAFCAAPANFRYHPFTLASYTARRAP
jgi:D-alanyl-D-alanine carboxypeptidase